METLLAEELDNGYIVKVQFDEGGPLSVRLENTENEFVGQIFSSFDTLRGNVLRFSNNTFSLSDEQFKKIKDEVVKKTKIEKSEGKKLRSLMNQEEVVNKNLNRFVYED